jgi:hypothetical protein
MIERQLGHLPHDYLQCLRNMLIEEWRTFNMLSVLRQRYVALSALAGVVAAYLLVGGIGSSTATADQVSPSMVDLKELRDLAEYISSTAYPPDPIWEITYATPAMQTNWQAVTGSGILHKVAVTKQSSEVLVDGVSVGFVAATFNSTSEVELNIRYESEVRVINIGNGRSATSVLYRPDPEP